MSTISFFPAGDDGFCVFLLERVQSTCPRGLVGRRSGGLLIFRYFDHFGSDFLEFSTENVQFSSESFAVFPKQKKQNFSGAENNETS